MLSGEKMGRCTFLKAQSLINVQVIHNYNFHVILHKDIAKRRIDVINRMGANGIIKKNINTVDKIKTIMPIMDKIADKGVIYYYICKFIYLKILNHVV